jgi:hypothetical protein
LSCGITAINGAILVWASDGEIFPRWGAVAGGLLVIGAAMLLWQRAWRDRHAEFAIVPVATGMVVATALYAAEGQWWTATAVVIAAAAFVSPLVRSWSAGRRSRARLDLDDVGANKAFPRSSDGIEDS